MTFYLQTYPYRRMVRHQVKNHEQTLGVNIREEEDTYILSALVPGITSDELNIQVLEDVVRIQAEYKPDEESYLVRELPRGSFRRTLRLPSAVDADHVEAQIDDGVLTLRLPKAESARSKQIKIQAK